MASVNDLRRVTCRELAVGKGQAVTSPTRLFANWAAGQPSRRLPEDEKWLYMDVDSGKWHDSHADRYTLGIVCRQSVPLPTGTLRLEGPFGGHRFHAFAGRPLFLEGLQGVGLKEGDFLLVKPTSPASCGTATAAPALGGE